METDNPQLVVFLQDLRAKTGSTDGQAKIDDLIVYYQKKYTEFSNYLFILSVGSGTN